MRFDSYAEHARLAASTSLGAGIIGIVFLVTLLVGLWFAVFDGAKDSSTPRFFTQKSVKSFETASREYVSRDWEDSAV